MKPWRPWWFEVNHCVTPYILGLVSTWHWLVAPGCLYSFKEVSELCVESIPIWSNLVCMQSLPSFNEIKLEIKVKENCFYCPFTFRGNIDHVALWVKTPIYHKLLINQKWKTTWHKFDRTSCLRIKGHKLYISKTQHRNIEITSFLISVPPILPHEKERIFVM